MTPPLGTLRALHRAHLLAIPYENLDIHLGRQITLDPEATFTKLVDERRGGWCFEMNGLFGRVLETLGFDIRYLSGAVGRATSGWRAQGNHLVLLVRLDRPWIADVGFGDGFLTPLPLEPGTYSQGFLQYRVARDGPRWTVHSHEFGGAEGFDFTLTARTLDQFGMQCRELQTSPESSFVKSHGVRAVRVQRPCHAAWRRPARSPRRQRDDAHRAGRDGVRPRAARAFRPRHSGCRRAVAERVGAAPAVAGRAGLARVGMTTNWFEELFGFAEQAYEETRANLEVVGTTLRIESERALVRGRRPQHSVGEGAAR